MSKQTVLIFSNYKVEITDLNHTLCHYNEGGEEIAVGKYQGQLSKPKWEELGFFPNMKQCLNRIRLEECRKDVEESIDKYLDRYENITNKLLEVNV